VNDEFDDKAIFTLNLSISREANNKSSETDLDTYFGFQSQCETLIAEGSAHQTEVNHSTTRWMIHSMTWLRTNMNTVHLQYRPACN